MPGICQKIILHPNYETYECNFWHIYIIFRVAYDNLYEFNLKYNKRSKKGQKRVQKR